MKPITVKIRGETWRVSRTGINGARCYRSRKLITVNRRAKGRALRRWLVHETLHAGHWDMDEEAVTELAIAIDAMLAAISDHRKGNHARSR